MQLVANGEPLEGEGNYIGTAGLEAVYEGQAAHPAVTVETKLSQIATVTAGSRRPRRFGEPPAYPQ